MKKVATETTVSCSDSVPLRTPVNEFYKKECQEKTHASTGGRVRCLDLQPTVYVECPDPSGFYSGRFPFP
jgi:hypothetical protein